LAIVRSGLVAQGQVSAPYLQPLTYAQGLAPGPNPIPVFGPASLAQWSGIAVMSLTPTPPDALSLLQSQNGFNFSLGTASFTTLVTLDANGDGSFNITPMAAGGGDEGLDILPLIRQIYLTLAAVSPSGQIIANPTPVLVYRLPGTPGGG
jgi:hypothetical protein